MRHDPSLHVLAIPHVVALIWRALLFMVACSFLGAAVQFVRTSDVLVNRRFFMAALGLVTARFVVVNIERLGDVVYLEGLPVDTVWLALASYGMWRWVYLERRGRQPPRS